MKILKIFNTGKETTGKYTCKECGSSEVKERDGFNEKMKDCTCKMCGHV